VRHPAGLAVTLFSVVAALCARVPALDPSFDINQYAHTSWKVRDGFTKGSIFSIAQTPDGYLWLGTEFGLIRFDGVRAVPWQPPGQQQLPAERIMSLLVSVDGTLWIGTKKGLANWKGGTLTGFRDLDGESIYALFQDREGTVWVGAGGSPRSGKLCAIRSGTVDCFGGEGQLSDAVTTFYEDRSGRLWVGVPYGLWRWKPGPPKFYPLAGEINGTQALAEDDDGTLLVGWKDGIYRFVEGRMQPYPLGGTPRKFRAKKIVRDRDNCLWVATWNYGLLHIHQGKMDVFSATDGLSGDDIMNLFEDREGNVWVSTLAGLDRFRDLAVATLTVKQGLSRNLVGSILADTDGSVWFATYGGLNRLDHGRITTERADPMREGKINGSTPDSLFQDKRSRVWISTFSQLGYLDRGHFTSVPSASGNILSIAQDDQSNIWLIDENTGLVRVSPQNEVRQIPWADLGHNDHASALIADPKEGSLWIGFVQGGITNFSGGQIRASYSAADGLGAGRVSDFYFDDGGALWISTEGGLGRLKNNRLVTLSSENGLPCDTVHWAIEDDDHSMWLYTACGLVRIARSDLDAWAAAVDQGNSSILPIKITTLDNSDGVKSLSSPSNYHPQVAKTPDGKLWFLPWDGVSVVDPRHLPFNKLPPPVHIEQVTADGKTYDPANGLQLPPHVRDLTIDYTALSLVAPEKIHFRYKLEGQDPDWREVVNDREVQYSNLAPRHYTFRVMASNNSGVWNETGASLEFSVLPAFYQTNWFRLLCVTAIVGLLWAVYRLRLYQIQRQFALGLEARVGERLRIARELHDTLLQSFQAAVFQFQAARKLLLRNADNAMEVVDEAIQAAEEGIKEGRSAIRDLRPEPAAQRNLSQLLDAAGRELSTAHELNGQAPSYRVLVEGQQQGLSPMLQDEVYRISREVIRNAFAHAAASHIEVEVRYDPDHLRVRVRDDGKGIDPKVLESGQSGHFGIPGMRERAQRIGARLNFWSEVGAGTEAELTVPASMAYQKRRNGNRFGLFRRAG
jgi:signal transduction histidine kinase/ligand-binding sensor domain-containing protein